MMLAGPGGMIPPPPGGQACEVLDGGVLSKNSGMLAVTRAMRAPDSGLGSRRRLSGTHAQGLLPGRQYNQLT